MSENDTYTGDSDHDELMAELRGDVRVSADVKYDKGKREYGDSWLDADPWYCLDRMEEEFFEFRQAVIHHQDPDSAIEEMADMLNYGLMFAVLTGLYGTDTDRPNGGER